MHAYCFFRCDVRICDRSLMRLDCFHGQLYSPISQWIDFPFTGHGLGDLIRLCQSSLLDFTPLQLSHLGRGSLPCRQPRLSREPHLKRHPCFDERLNHRSVGVLTPD